MSVDKDTARRPLTSMWSRRECEWIANCTARREKP
jgi:hypothetical protein